MGVNWTVKQIETIVLVFFIKSFSRHCSTANLKYDVSDWYRGEDTATPSNPRQPHQLLRSLLQASRHFPHTSHHHPSRLHQPYRQRQVCVPTLSALHRSAPLSIHVLLLPGRPRQTCRTPWRSRQYQRSRGIYQYHRQVQRELHCKAYSDIVPSFLSKPSHKVRKLVAWPAVNSHLIPNAGIESL